jgi:hypothetical protein
MNINQYPLYIHFVLETLRKEIETHLEHELFIQEIWHAFIFEVSSKKPVYLPQRCLSQHIFYGTLWHMIRSKRRQQPKRRLLLDKQC